VDESVIRLIPLSHRSTANRLQNLVTERAGSPPIDRLRATEKRLRGEGQAA